MSTDRRTFLEQLGASATLFGSVPLLVNNGGLLNEEINDAQQPNWDLTWTNRVNTKHKAAFDVPEIESGYGVWRASIWMNQYREVLGAAERDLRAVLILRHNGIALAMQQAFWDEYQVGKAKNVTHPTTGQPTEKNPALLRETDGVGEPFTTFALDRFIARGGIALACNLAFEDCVGLVKAKHGLSDEAARARARSALVPGVIMQPSGVFAAVRAQEVGAVYVRAS